MIPLASLVLVSGLRYRVGTDFQTYTPLYEMAGDYQNVWQIFGFGTAKMATDPGFTALLWLMNFITKDPQIMYITVAAVTYSFIMKTLADYGRPFELSVFLFLGTFHYYASFNGIRQYMVAAALFWAIRYIISGNWKRYFLIVLISSLFHSSALIMIPVYFIVRRKAWSPAIFGLSALFLGMTFYIKNLFLCLSLCLKTAHTAIMKMAHDKHKWNECDQNRCLGSAAVSRLLLQSASAEAVAANRYRRQFVPARVFVRAFGHKGRDLCQIQYLFRPVSNDLSPLFRQDL